MKSDILAATSEERKIEGLFQLGICLGRTNGDSLKFYADSLSSSDFSSPELENAGQTFMKAVDLFANNQLDEAISLFEESTAQLKNLNVPNLYYRCRNYLGIAYTRTGDLEKAVVFFEETLDEIDAEEAEVAHKRAAHANMINVYRRAQDYASAIYHSEMLISLSDEGTMSRSLAFSYMNMGQILLDLRYYQRALDAFNTIDPEFLTGSMPIAVDKNRARAFYELEQYDSAIFYFERSLAYSGPTFNPDLKKSSFVSLIDLYTKTNQLTKIPDLISNATEQIQPSDPIPLNVDFAIAKMNYFAALGQEDNLLKEGLALEEFLTEKNALSFSQDAFLIMSEIYNQKEENDLAFKLNILDVNEEGTALTITESVIDENAEANTPVGSFETNDPDTNDQQVFLFVDGKGAEGNQLFSIVENQLIKKTPLNHEEKSSYSIRVLAEDKAGNTIVSVFTINVKDMNDAPTAIRASRTLQLFENVEIGTLVSKLTVQDEDANDTHTIDLVDGTGAEDNSLFIIENNRIFTKGEIDYEKDTLLSIHLRAVDQGGASVEEVLAIEVRNELEGQISLEQRLDFGSTDVGNSIVLPLAITNTGELDVQINNIQLPQGFSLAEQFDAIAVGETRQLQLSFKPSDDRNYQGQLLIITNIGGYSVELLGTGEQVITDIDENPFENSQLNLYPNPTSDVVNVDLRTIPLRVQLIEISDMKGRVIFSTVRGNLDIMQI